MGIIFWIKEGKAHTDKAKNILEVLYKYKKIALENPTTVSKLLADIIQLEEYSIDNYITGVLTVDQTVIKYTKLHIEKLGEFLELCDKNIYTVELLCRMKEELQKICEEI